MNFLNPALLAGLAALAIPVIVHFLNRRRFRKVPWAAMRFLQVSIERNKRRMQVEDWILLALRLLIVALIVFALARPALEKLGVLPSLSGGVASAVVIDTSASMGRTDSGSAGTRFEAARSAAAGVLETLPGGSSSAISLAANTSAPGSATGDLSRVAAELERAQPTHRSSDLAPAISAAIDSLESRTASSRELVIITDGEATAWRDFETITRRLEIAGESVRTIVAIVGGKPRTNLAITRIEQSSPIAAVGTPLGLTVEVTNFGAEDANEVGIQLEVNAAPEAEAIIVDTIPAGASHTSTLFAQLPSPGFHRITAALVGTDALPADDTRTLIVRTVEQERALLVDGSPDASATFFLQNALVPVPADAAESFYLATDTISIAGLADAPLEDYRAVFLANVAEVSSEIAARLTTFVEAGGGLVSFAGDRLNRSFYNDTLHRETALLPASYLDVANGPLTLQSSGYAHPLVALWDNAGAGSLADITITKAMPLSIPSNSTAAVILRFDDGRPAVIESSLGLGRVFQFALSADTSWTDLPVRPAFLPIVQRLFGRMLNARDTGLNLEVGENFIRNGPPDWIGKSGTVFSTGAGTSKGAIVPVTADGAGGSRIEFPTTDLAGAYEFTLSDHSVAIPFATNLSPRESDPEQLTAAQLDRLRALTEVVRLSDGADLNDALGRKRSGTELWPLLIFAVALLAVVELFLAQRFSQQK